MSTLVKAESSEPCWDPGMVLGGIPVGLIAKSFSCWDWESHWEPIANYRSILLLILHAIILIVQITQRTATFL